MSDLYSDIKKIATPAFVVDKGLLIKNLELLKRVADESGCKILLAQKAFSMFALYPLIGEYLSGTTASGLYEAKLGYEEMGKENHVFSPAYTDGEFDEILEICDHVVFNSFAQWARFRDRCAKSRRSIGLRINPEHSTQEHGIYDPCSPGSRLGITKANFTLGLERYGAKIEDFDGLHFHTLCEQNSDALEETLSAVEEKFGEYLHKMKWINFGGGHHITRDDYDVERLIRLIKRTAEKYNAQIYLEPGEAVVLNTGFLVSSVIDIIPNGTVTNLILDTSAACHMPDVIEMPYRPPVYQSGEPNEKAHTYRLGGPTCLAGDIIGDYSFDYELKIGDKVIFCDMALYTMVKTNTFNGMRLPDIAVRETNGECGVVRSFGYGEFKGRLS
jgi:carboxynorspermidine decarboxylase